MALKGQFTMLKSVRNSVLAAALGFGMLAGVAEAAPIAPNSMPAIRLAHRTGGRCRPSSSSCCPSSPSPCLLVASRTTRLPLALTRATGRDLQRGAGNMTGALTTKTFLDIQDLHALSRGNRSAHASAIGRVSRPNPGLAAGRPSPACRAQLPLPKFRPGAWLCYRDWRTRGSGRPPSRHKLRLGLCDGRLANEEDQGFA